VHAYPWMLQQRVFDILNPEVNISGISDVRKIGTLAAAFGAKLDKDGCLPLPQKPGLGVEIRSDLVAKG
jgi:L-alanine-DL-glutamate epimerase-like enolase superfamily enzyme